MSWRGPRAGAGGAEEIDTRAGRTSASRGVRASAGWVPCLLWCAGVGQHAPSLCAMCAREGMWWYSDGGCRGNSRRQVGGFCPE
jgi:hypothetical protein